MTKKKATRKTALTTGNRREIDRETNKIMRLKGKIAENFWDLGDSLVRVNDRKLFRAAGYRGFEEYLEKEVKIGRTTAYELMDLARNFSRETAIQFGKSKLLCAIDYAKATPEKDRPLDVTRYAIEVKNAAGKKIQKSFKQASVREIKRAAELLRKELKPEKPPAPLQIPALSGLLSGKTPKFRIAPFLAKAKEKLKDLSPRPTVKLTTVKKGADPLVDLQLSNVRAAQLLQALGLLAAAAVEVWMGSVR